MQIVTLSHFSTKSETYLGYFLYYYSHAFHRDLLVSEVITLLRHDAEIYRFHVGVPEYSYLTIRKLRAFGKKTKINKWRDLCRTLASQLEDHSSFAKKNRVKLGKSPIWRMTSVAGNESGEEISTPLDLPGRVHNAKGERRCGGRGPDDQIDRTNQREQR